MTARGLGLCVLLGCFALACNDRTRDPVLQFEPPRSQDAGQDVVDAGVVVEPDDLCRDAIDGVQCGLPNATGICVTRRCRFVACESGFDDCDAEPGCETALDGTESCGGCGVTCEADQVCARGEASFVCARGIVCPRDRYDLDGDSGNGCEVSSTWGDPLTLIPPDLAVEAAGATPTAILLAGSTEEARVSTALPAAPYAWAGTPAEAAPAIAIAAHGDGVRVLWQDGLSQHSGGEESFRTVDCEEAAAPRRYVGLAADRVATDAEIAQVGPTQLEPVFGWADYLAAFYPTDAGTSSFSFTDEEVADCVPCHFDPVTGDSTAPSQCVGLRQCRDASFDGTACAGCPPLGAECPDFDIVDLVEANDVLIAVTARGIVLFDSSTLEPIGRAEARYDSTVFGGPRFVGADAIGLDDETTLVALYHSTGFVRGLRITRAGGVEIAPAFPDRALGIDFEANPRRMNARLLVVLEGEDVKVARPETSGRSAWVTRDSAPGIRGLRPFGVIEQGGTLVVLYEAAGQVYPRSIRED